MGSGNAPLNVLTVLIVLGNFSAYKWRNDGLKKSSCTLIGVVKHIDRRS